MDKKQQQIFDLSMQRAALRQYLRDNSANMTESQINRVLEGYRSLRKRVSHQTGKITLPSLTKQATWKQQHKHSSN